MQTATTGKASSSARVTASCTVHAATQNLQLLWQGGEGGAGTRPEGHEAGADVVEVLLAGRRRHDAAGAYAPDTHSSV